MRKKGDPDDEDDGDRMQEEEDDDEDAAPASVYATMQNCRGLSKEKEGGPPQMRLAVLL